MILNVESQRKGTGLARSLNIIDRILNCISVSYIQDVAARMREIRGTAHAEIRYLITFLSY